MIVTNIGFIPHKCLPFNSISTLIIIAVGVRTLRKQRSHSTFMRHQILSAYFLRILLSDFLQKGKVLTVGSENQFASNFKSNKHYERMLLKKWQNSRWMPGINLEIII